MPIGAPDNFDDDLSSSEAVLNRYGKKLKLLKPYTSAQIEDLRNGTRARAAQVMAGI